LRDILDCNADFYDFRGSIIINTTEPKTKIIIEIP
jgi:hypothetical protein